MKFSVLLPTRNRLSLLRYAIESVRRQDYDDWEIIVSDNFSEEDIAGYVHGLGDPRIQCFRTERFVPVTENWNNALERSRGDYIIMLGDDDCLLPSYFSTVRRLVEEHGQPDLLYSSGYMYAYPGVIPGYPKGYLFRSGCASFLRHSDEPFFLDRASARQMVEHSLQFQLRFDYNMQYSTVSRRLIAALHTQGPFFQSPFPDFYATNVAFLKAERILVCPQPLVVIGISPKSYGFYHFNQQEQTGIAFLQCLPDAGLARRLKKMILPGSNMNTSWLFAMETIKANYGAELGLQVHYRRYRDLHLLSYYERFATKEGTSPERRELRRGFRWWERCLWRSRLRWARFFGKECPRQLLVQTRKQLAQYPDDWQAEFIPQSCTNILDVFDFIANQRIKQ
jgi:glycosyltransferase involved in cell wall biosynthesis